MITLASWNVNSIRARLPRVLAWLDQHAPDVLCMQELKVERKDFPWAEFRERGYHVHACFQRSYNGVGIATRAPLLEPTAGFDDGMDDTQARIVSGVLSGVRLICCYVPNGQSLGSDKYEYKMEWMKRLRSWLDRTFRPDEKLLICGDFNVAPEERDVHNPAVWQRSTLFHQSAREALAHVAGFGLVDSLRLLHQDAGLYSWWDYRMLAFPRNLGLRIDHAFVTKPLAALVREVTIDREARKGKLPSDHAPVLVKLDVLAPDAVAPSAAQTPGQGALPL